MLKKELIRRNPLTLMGYSAEDILEAGEFGALTARAGVGKTAFLVQLALDKLLRGQNVLHISLSEPVDKVCLWYEEVMRNLAFQCNIAQTDPFWDIILPNRFIMTFKSDVFTVPTLEERLTDLTEQGIFFPRMMLIDGFPLAETAREELESLKNLAKAHGMSIWFAVRTHRHEPPDENGTPKAMTDVSDLFNVILMLQPDGKDIYVQAVKGGPEDRADAPSLVMDPATHMLREVQTAAAG